MRISKSLAEQVAKKLLEKKRDAIKKIQLELNKKSQEITFSYLDKDLVKTFEKYKSYFITARYVGFYSIINDTRVSLELMLAIDYPHNDGWKKYIEISSEEYTLLNDLSLKKEQLDKDYKKSLSIVSETIFGLKTALQVKKHFPEAFEYLPKETNSTMLPMVNLDQVRALVQTN